MRGSSGMIETSTCSLRLITALCLMSTSTLFYRASALPIPRTPVAPVARQVDGTTLQKPIFHTYVDDWNNNGIPPAEKLKGFNVVSLAFYTSKGPADSALWWQNLGSEKQMKYKEEYNAAGIKLFVSLFGGSEEEEKISENIPNPAPLAAEIGNWVKQNNLDGVDVDYEGFSAMIAGTGEKWVIDFQKKLRSILPSPQYLICHTPVAWWFMPNRWPGGGYAFVHKEVGNTIDWYNVQFYNVNDIEYTSTCKGLLIQSSSQYPQTSLFEIAITSSIPLEKLVIGKPPTKEDAGHGTMDPDLLAKCLWAAKMMGWNGGVMGWKWPNANSSWITSVRSQAFPINEDT